jgi:succinate-semialdehyde dehydrogenase / glutarate-semialdehyde dehydrogenase
VVFFSANPFTEEKLGSFKEINSCEANEIVIKTHQAFLGWKRISVEERASFVTNLAKILKKNANSYAEIITKEMGKPIKQATAEVEKCALLCEYYASTAKNFLAVQIIKTEAKKSYIAFEPLGVVLGIMPWNFPFWQVFRFAIPALLAGNVCLLKHAANVWHCALKIEEIFNQAGFFSDVFHTLLIGKEKVHEIIENSLVKGVAFTGSVQAGSLVAKKSGEKIKKTVLELGGSDAYVVLGDADIKNAAKICVKSRMLNSGQSCIAAKRFIVVEQVYRKFKELVVMEMKQKKMGDPMDENIDLGPLARKDLRDELHQQVKNSINMGARCLLGGKIPLRKGYFYPPTVLCDVKKGMPAYDEELFGPVAVILQAKDEKDAIAIANDSNFGLGAAVFTNNIKRGQEIAQTELDAGSCFVNDFVRSDPRLPFGGVKQSGYGRELSEFGLKEFVNIKTIYVQS